MASKELLFDISGIDLTKVVADIDTIRKYNPQRFDMEQITAIVHEDAEHNRCIGYKDITAEFQKPDAPCETPDARGAFYFFTRVPTQLDAMTVAERLIREHKVATMPGNAFGASTQCCLRLSYGLLDDGNAQEGVHRLVRGLRAIIDR